MKFNSVLSLVVLALASKVSAECFSEKLGYPCCSETTDVVSVDANGKWGLENGTICGIKPINTEIPVVNNNTLLEKRLNTDYMDKIKITEFCPAEFVERKEGVEYPSINQLTYYSTTTESERPLIVLLPPNYTETKKYPVLYLLHGIMGTGMFMLQEGFGTVAIPGNLYAKNMAKEMIIVLPDQYAPAPGTEVEPDLNEEYFAGYNNFINDLINDIMPFLEKNYSIATGRENTALCGYSFGGRNSLYIGLKRPDLFGYIGAFSPAPGLVPGDDIFTGHHTGLFSEDEVYYHTENPPFVTMLSCGTNDTVVGTFPKSYHEILTKNNQKHIWYEITGMDHQDNESLTSALYNFLTSVFGQLEDEKEEEKVKDIPVTTTTIEKPCKKIIKTKKAKKTKKY